MVIDEKKIRKIGMIAALVVSLGGSTVIAGWQFRIPWMRGEVLDNFAAPNTGLLMLLCGLAVILQSTQYKFLRLLGAALSLPVFALGLATFVERIAGVDLGVDRLFMAHRLSDWGSKIPFPGRMSTTTSANFMLAGVAIATLKIRARKPISDFFAAGIGTVCYFGMIGYLYATKLLYGSVTSSVTVALFTILTISLWSSSRTLTFARYITGDLAGGIMARRVVLSILMVMPLLGWLEVRGRNADLFSREVGIALFVVVATVIFTALALHTALTLDAIDSRRSQAEAGLIQTEKLAAAGRMAATIAHEINNPLGAVTNLLYLCRTVEMDSKTRDSYLEMAEEEVRHLAMISKQTLGFYRESASPMVVDCAELTQQVISLYRSRLANKGVELQQNLDPDVMVWCVAGELRQVLVNLVSNALDACPSKGGIISITSSQIAGTVQIEVSDNGHGVNERDRERIFEPFFTTKESFGTGLGLWVSKGLMQKNGGRLELISNKLPFRTTFRLSLPAVTAADKGATASRLA